MAFHVHLIAPSNEDSTYIKPLWAATLGAHTPNDVELTFRDDGLDPIDLEKESDAKDDDYRPLVGMKLPRRDLIRSMRWPLNLLMRELAEKKIAGGDRTWRKHRMLDLPMGL